MIRYIFEEVTAVIVFRSSPNDKAQVVKFVQRNPEAYTLSIGDGGNDVNMI
jgi:P-type E1-E2 ATPase